MADINILWNGHSGRIWYETDIYLSYLLLVSVNIRKSGMESDKPRQGLRARGRATSVDYKCRARQKIKRDKKRRKERKNA